MSTGIRWGVLGAGYVAGTFGRAARHAGITISAVGSRSPERGRAYAMSHGIDVVHDSYEELVADERVDAVYVATPHTWHAEHALLALDAGKHVLVEKPIAVNAAEAALIHERAADRGLIALDGMWSRYLPMMRRIREIVGDGLLGDLVSVIADHSQALTDDPLHRINNPELGGGALLDLGVYPIAFVLDLLGPPVSVTATGTLRPTGVDAQATVVVRDAAGACGIAHTASNAPGPVSASVLGTAGRIDIARNFYAPSSFVRVNRANEVVEEFVSPDPFTGFTHEMVEMQRLVDAGERISPCLTPEASVDIMRVLDAARRELGVTYPSELQQGADA